MNRQQRRSMQRTGQATEAGAAETSAPDDVPARPRPLQPGATRRRATPRQFLHEVNVEMRKVAWPTRAETINYASVVLVTLILVMALIFGLDTGFSQLSLDLFK